MRLSARRPPPQKEESHRPPLVDVIEEMELLDGESVILARRDDGLHIDTRTPSVSDEIAALPGFGKERQGLEGPLGIVRQKNIHDVIITGIFLSLPRP